MMVAKTKIYQYRTLGRVATRLRDDLNSQNFVLLFAYNGTGKTRLSMEFKKYRSHDERKTLYFNAFTEDLFFWDNDLDGDRERVLKLNSDSRFFSGFKDLALENKIYDYLSRYAGFEFKVDYENWTISFSRDDEQNIKISRGEENIFIWCVFLALCELVVDGHGSYAWVKNFYIDDPISSLDDNNAIAVACDLAQLLKRANEERQIKAVISTHHGLFFNVMFNELRKSGAKTYYYHKAEGEGLYTLQATDDTPFFHHVALLSELKQAADAGKLYTYHFNVLRSVMEKTAAFFGYKNFSECIKGVDDETLFARALNLLSHGNYSVYQPKEMVADTQRLFKQILDGFLSNYKFDTPTLVGEERRT